MRRVRDAVLRLGVPFPDLLVNDCGALGRLTFVISSVNYE